MFIRTYYQAGGRLVLLQLQGLERPLSLVVVRCTWHASNPRVNYHFYHSPSRSAQLQCYIMACCV